jgi:hypothetical protein
MELTWEDVKDFARVVYDYPSRKLAVYAEEAGLVVLFSVEDGESKYSIARADEIPALVNALCAAGEEAAEIERRRDAEYVTFGAIEKAKGS